MAGFQPLLTKQLEKGSMPADCWHEYANNKTHREQMASLDPVVRFVMPFDCRADYHIKQGVTEAVAVAPKQSLLFQGLKLGEFPFPLHKPHKLSSRVSSAGLIFYNNLDGKA